MEADNTRPRYVPYTIKVKRDGDLQEVNPRDLTNSELCHLLSELSIDSEFSTSDECHDWNLAIEEAVRRLKQNGEQDNVDMLYDAKAVGNAAAMCKADSIHRAMVLIAGIEMENPEDPPRLWTALEDAYDALSDALGTDGDTTADEEEAKVTGRHFVVRTSCDSAKLREALQTIHDKVNSLDEECGVDPVEIRDIARAALAKPPRNCDRFNTGNPIKDAEDAYSAWQRYCDDPTIPPSCKVESAFRQWLFATAKPEKEGG